MEDKSKHNLNQFIKKLQYHGAIQRMNDMTGRYNEKVSLNDLNMKLPCGAYITSMILLTDTEDNIKYSMPWDKPFIVTERSLVV